MLQEILLILILQLFWIQNELYVKYPSSGQLENINGKVFGHCLEL